MLGVFQSNTEKLHLNYWLATNAHSKKCFSRKFLHRVVVRFFNLTSFKNLSCIGGRLSDDFYGNQHPKVLVQKFKPTLTFSIFNRMVANQTGSNRYQEHPSQPPSTTECKINIFKTFCLLTCDMLDGFIYITRWSFIYD